MNYRPKPVDTRSVVLDASLVELVEYLARNTHEVWAQTRCGDGWTWGEQRNDARKLHPSLIPYDQLSDAEQQLDRNTAVETLKLITALGYRILPPEASSSDHGDTPVDRASIATAGLGRLIQWWESLAADRRHGPPMLYSEVAHRALALGEHLLAYDVAKLGLRLHPWNLRLRQQLALSLARGGACDAARIIFEELRAEKHFDEETLAGLARCYKDLWERPTGSERDRAWLIKACDTYEDAWNRHHGSWSVINAATLAACLGDKERSANNARFAIAESLREIESAKPGADCYWPLATLGEASLVLGDLAEAERYYGLAVKEAGVRFGNLSSTRRNARLLLQHLGHAKDAEPLLNRWLRLPRVVVFSGHMIDAPGRSVPRFPPALEGVVATAIAKRLDEIDAGFGYASAACGSDLLFLEAILARGGEANVVLPYETDRFMLNSVSRGGAEWEARFRKVLQTPGVRLITASQGTIQGDSVMNAYANLFTFGMAGTRAWQLGTELAPLAVWDGKPGDGAGGTSDAVAKWQLRGCSAIIINPLSLPGGNTAGMNHGSDNRGPALPATPAASNLKPAIKLSAAGAVQAQMVALLFADVVGFSKLTEDELPLFIEHFLHPASKLAGADGRCPLQMNTWGDGLYFVFEKVSEAGQLALDLRDLVGKTDWVKLGFHGQLSLRTALHVGPVHAYLNPATGRPDFIGTHVSRAARIEPITPPGQVYASEAFAAIAFAEHAEGFRCEYVGQIGLAKQYGTFPTYHVRRSGFEYRDG